MLKKYFSLSGLILSGIYLIWALSDLQKYQICIDQGGWLCGIMNFTGTAYGNTFIRVGIRIIGAYLIGLLSEKLVRGITESFILKILLSVGLGLIILMGFIFAIPYVENVLSSLFIGYL